MDYLKKAQQQLKDHKETVKTMELLPTILKKNKLEIYITEKALENMEEIERTVLQRTCMDGIKPQKLEKELKMNYRKIYRIKDAALKKFARMCYGIELWEGDNEK